MCCIQFFTITQSPKLYKRRFLVSDITVHTCLSKMLIKNVNAINSDEKCHHKVNNHCIKAVQVGMMFLTQSCHLTVNVR